MDGFFSKYGWVVVIGVCITFVVAMLSPVGNLVMGETIGFVDTMSDKVEYLITGEEPDAPLEPLVGDAYAIMYDDIEGNTIMAFIRSEEPIKKGNIYKGQYINYVFTGIENSESVPWNATHATLTEEVHFNDKIRPVCTAGWFAGFRNCYAFNNMYNLDTRNVTDMSNMFSEAGTHTSGLTLDVSSFDTSKVTNMSWMFYGFAGGANTSIIHGLSNWKVDNVTNMSKMFFACGSASTSWSIGDLSTWNVGKVENMGQMFMNSGQNSENWTVGNLDNWNVSSVTDMRSMFYKSGNNSKTWSVGNLDNWNVSNVTTMANMFEEAGRRTVEDWNLGDISKWNTSNVTNMRYMFSYAGTYNSSWYIDCSSWDVHKVTEYEYFNNSRTKNIKVPTWVN